MSMSQMVYDDGASVVIRIPRRFDFSVHKDFRDAYRDTAGTGISYRIDLSETEYMDSSALGMLLLLREHAGGDDADITLVQPSEAVRKVLEIANFDRLFSIQ